MAIFLKIEEGIITESEMDDFELYEIGTTKLHFKGFSSEEIRGVPSAYAAQSLPEYLNAQQTNFDTFFSHSYKSVR